MLIDGIHIPLTMPFTRDGATYLRKLEYNIGRYSLTPAAGLVALTGEGAALSDEETREALQVIGATAAPEKVLIAAIARDSVRASLALAEAAATAWFDAVLLSAPPQAQPLTHAERMLFFNTIADASPLPVLLSSHGSVPGMQLSVETVATLSRHPNILGLYADDPTTAQYRELADATCEVKHEVAVTLIFAPVTRRMLTAAGAATTISAASLAGGAAVAVAPSGAALKTRKKTVGFQIMGAGRVAGLVNQLKAGVAGAMPRLAACAPQATYEVYAAFKDGDPALAAEKEQRLMAADALLAKQGIAAVKYGCDLNGYFGGSVRLPRLGLDSAQRHEVEQALAGLKN